MHVLVVLATIVANWRPRARCYTLEARLWMAFTFDDIHFLCYDMQLNVVMLLKTTTHGDVMLSPLALPKENR